jgi:K+-sensing histidine kinase KdpD
MRTSLKSIFGIAACAGTAVLLTVFLKDGEDIRPAAPAICLQAVIFTSVYWGRLSGIIGSITASLTFAIFLFPPIGSMAIHDPTERVMLTLFQLAALVVFFISPRNSCSDMWVSIRPRPSTLKASVRQSSKWRDAE